MGPKKQLKKNGREVSKIVARIEQADKKMLNKHQAE